MTFSYKLNQHLLGRNAAQLVYQLKELHTSVSIQRKDSESYVNAKSLVGLLSGCYKIGDVITVFIDEVEDQSRVKELLNEYGNELGGD